MERTLTDRIREKNGHCNCLMCGNKNPFSLRLEFRVEDGGEVHTVFRGNPTLQGYDGILHGGVITSLLDSAMTHCLFHHGIEAVTGELKVRFIKSVPFDSLLNLKARLTKSTPPLYILESELIRDGSVMAKAKAKFMNRPGI